LSCALVTGGAGFIGRRLALALRAEGLEVRALVRSEHDARDLEAADVEVLRGDASDLATIETAAERCRVIYHLAAARGARKLGYRAYQEQNRKLSEAVAGAATRVGVARVVFTSTATLTGYWGPGRQTEDTPPQPNSAYRSSRVVAEEVFDRFAERQGLDVVTARVPQRVMGPGALGWAGTVQSVRDGRIRILPEGGSVHSADVDDVVDALMRCAATPGIGGRRYLLGAASPIQTAELLGRIADQLGVRFAPRIVAAAPFRTWVAVGDFIYRWTRRELPYHFTAEFYSARVQYDIARARRELGWAPRFEPPLSVARTVSWLREEGLV
jgi:nucleoside-diphosphate-sugar epimerase